MSLKECVKAKKKKKGDARWIEKIKLQLYEEVCTRPHSMKELCLRQATDDDDDHDDDDDDNDGDDDNDDDDDEMMMTTTIMMMKMMMMMMMTTTTTILLVSKSYAMDTSAIKSIGKTRFIYRTTIYPM